MSATGEATLICDGCGETEAVELEVPGRFDPHSPSSVEDAIDTEGWSWDTTSNGLTGDKLLCPECAEEAESS